MDLSDTAALAAVRNEKTQHRVPVRVSAKLLAAPDVVVERANVYGDWVVRSRSLKRDSAYFGPPLGHVGGSVWGREGYQVVEAPPGATWQKCVIYRADGAAAFFVGRCKVFVAGPPPQVRDGWRSSANMPVACSRAFYTVKEVRCGRLHDMGAEEFRAEGLPDMDTFAREWDIRHRGYYPWRDNPRVLITILERDYRGPV